MAVPPTTCWTLIKGAADGDHGDREMFARRYSRVIRSYLRGRWSRRWPTMLGYLDDALQEVFVDCFREGGVLERVDPARSGGFRAFLYGVTRKVALRFETRCAKCPDLQPSSELSFDQLAGEDRRCSAIFDRAWAESVLREALELQTFEADKKDDRARRRILLLRLRTNDGLPIREIARQWQQDPTHLHREYALARREFKRALQAVLATHGCGATVTPTELSARVAQDPSGPKRAKKAGAKTPTRRDEP